MPLHPDLALRKSVLDSGRKLVNPKASTVETGALDVQAKRDADSFKPTPTGETGGVDVNGKAGDAGTSTSPPTAETEVAMGVDLVVDANETAPSNTNSGVQCAPDTNKDVPDSEREPMNIAQAEDKEQEITKKPYLGGGGDGAPTGSCHGDSVPGGSSHGNSAPGGDTDGDHCKANIKQGNDGIPTQLQHANDTPKPKLEGENGVEKKSPEPSKEQLRYNDLMQSLVSLDIINQ